MSSRTLCLLVLMSMQAVTRGQEIETVVQAGHYAAVTAVCYSPDGKFIATGSADKTIILWRSSDGKEIRSFRGSSSGIGHLEFNRDGTGILSLGDDGTCIAWDVMTGKQIKKINTDSRKLTCASFSPEGTQIVTGS